MCKITSKDYIGWVVAIICAFIAGDFFTQKQQLLTDNKKLINITQEIHNSAQIMQQYITTNNYNLPTVIKENIDTISVATGDIVKANVFGDKH